MQHLKTTRVYNLNPKKRVGRIDLDKQFALCAWANIWLVSRIAETRHLQDRLYR